MNKLTVTVLGLLFLSLALFTGIYYWWSRQLQPTQPGSSQEITFTVAPDQTAAQTINELTNNGLITSSLAAKLYLQFSALDQKIRPGTYSLSPGLDLPAIFKALTSGPSDIWVTIPEGWRREQIAVRLAAALPDFDSTGFLAQSATLEGQLFPDTYLIPPSSSVSQVINIFLTNFARKTGLDLPRQNDVLVLASLVEREAKTDSDRTVIAGIFYKRLAANWPLQVDASVQYALGTSRQWWPQNIDTKYPSAYNTYVHSGLPPTPIASPGLASIQAALHPQGSPYWYYLTGKDGRTYYARTLVQHNLNIDKYLLP
ncbi:endolytic transglycosylase MltG [Candidatus Amesbacteria bacterium]|nr:endolytic transglycosylase MltG [Candidatus Amesbacteria bacterium]